MIFTVNSIQYKSDAMSLFCAKSPETRFFCNFLHRECRMNIWLVWRAIYQFRTKKTNRTNFLALLQPTDSQSINEVDVHVIDELRIDFASHLPVKTIVNRARDQILSILFDSFSRYEKQLEKNALLYNH